MVLDRWDAVEMDLQERGVDVGDPELMANRSWRWLRVRIAGLLSADTRLSRSLSTSQGREAVSS